MTGIPHRIIGVTKRTTRAITIEVKFRRIDALSRATFSKMARLSYGQTAVSRRFSTRVTAGLERDQNADFDFKHALKEP
jgi:hypothetical protein